MHKTFKRDPNNFEKIAKIVDNLSYNIDNIDEIVRDPSFNISQILLEINEIKNQTFNLENQLLAKELSSPEPSAKIKSIALTRF